MNDVCAPRNDGDIHKSRSSLGGIFVDIMMKKKLPLTVLSAILFLFLSCVSRPQFTPENEAALYPVASYIPESFDWQELCPGIYRCDFNNPDFPVIYHAVKIDLTLEGLELVCFPDQNTVAQAGANVDGEVPQPFIYKGIRTQKFAELYGCMVAVNLSPFSGKNGKWDLPAKLGSVRQLVGLHLADGLMISKPLSRYAGLYFKREKGSEGKSAWRASIEKNQSDKTAAASDFAFGGFYLVLENGIVDQGFIRNHDSRTGAGISEDGRTLYLLVVEGENQLKSQGLSYPQCGEIFKAMGCTDALEMDGGGSSELCINGSSVLSYSNFRTQANSLGFRINSQKDLK